MTEEKQNSSDYGFEINPIGFASKIDYATMYNIFYAKLSELHFLGQDDRAIEYFNMGLGHFAILFDEMFVLNCLDINEKYPDISQRYMLQLAELSTLMMRAGVAPKPDIELIYEARWEVPKSLDELSLDGKTNLGNNDYEQD